MVGYSLMRICPSWNPRTSESGEPFFFSVSRQTEAKSAGLPQSVHSAHCLLFHPNNLVSKTLVHRTPTSLAK